MKINRYDKISCNFMIVLKQLKYIDILYIKTDKLIKF
jgi:hypothetical protein